MQPGAPPTKLECMHHQIPAPENPDPSNTKFRGGNMFSLGPGRTHQFFWNEPKWRRVLPGHVEPTNEVPEVGVE